LLVVNFSGQRWLTCTPVSFVGDESFFARDSGLICKGLQELGCQAQAIMPTPAHSKDIQRDLLRVPYSQLSQPGFWRSLNAHGVVFYGWGLGRYVPIVRAIKAAGLFLVSNLDSSGLMGILNGPAAYWSSTWRIATAGGVNSQSLLAFFVKFLASLTWSLGKHDLGRVLHLRQADIIGAVSPLACKRIRRLCQIYGGEALAKRVRLIPHPVASYMEYSGQIKRPEVTVVGRWKPEDWVQKNPWLLAETMRQVFSQNPDCGFTVLGAFGTPVSSLMGRVLGPSAQKVKWLGRRPNREIATAYQASQISFCPSSFESFHIASAEALCCGCSIVGSDLPELPGLAWFAQEPHGRLAAHSPGPLAEAILSELADWQRGQRCPAQISSIWKERLHARQVAHQILRQAHHSTDSLFAQAPSKP